MLQLSSSIDPKKEKKKKTPIVVTTVLLTELPAHAARRRNFLSVFSCQGSFIAWIQFREKKLAHRPVQWSKKKMVSATSKKLLRECESVRWECESVRDTIHRTFENVCTFFVCSALSLFVQYIGLWELFVQYIGLWEWVPSVYTFSVCSALSLFVQ